MTGIRVFLDDHDHHDLDRKYYTFSSYVFNSAMDHIIPIPNSSFDEIYITQANLVFMFTICQNDRYIYLTLMKSQNE